MTLAALHQAYTCERAYCLLRIDASMYRGMLCYVHELHLPSCWYSSNFGWGTSQPRGNVCWWWRLQRRKFVIISSSEASSSCSAPLPVWPVSHGAVEPPLNIFEPYVRRQWVILPCHECFANLFCIRFLVGVVVCVIAKPQGVSCFVDECSALCSHLIYVSTVGVVLLA